MAEFSLDEVLARHGTVLVVDTAGAAQAGWASDAGGARFCRAEGDAGTALFAAVRGLAGESGPARLIAEAGAFVFCAGPGSVLGIRTAALTLRLWTALRSRPVFSYHALELLAAAHGDGIAFIADARRGEWHWQTSTAPAARVPEAELQAHADARGLTLATPHGFRAWGKAPHSVRVVPYEVSELLQSARDQPLLRPAPAPDADLLGSANYVRWQPQMHRSPSP